MNFRLFLKCFYIILFVLICFIVKFFFINKDYSEYKFLGEWGSGTEIITFGKNGNFSYYESGSGNAVDDYDLCDKYSYNDSSKTFKINCYPGAIDVYRKIELVSVDDKIMILKFGSEKKNFVKIRDYDDYKIANFWTRESNGKVENLRLYSDGDFSYTFEKVIPIVLYDKYELYDSSNFSKHSNFICAKEFTEEDFIDKDGASVEEFQIDCPIDLLDDKNYVYDKDNTLIRIFSSDDPYNETLMKILNVTDEFLKVEYNGEILEFTR